MIKKIFFFIKKAFGRNTQAREIQKELKDTRGLKMRECGDLCDNSRERMEDHQAK